MNTPLTPQSESNLQDLDRQCVRLQQELASFCFMQDVDLNAISPLFGYRQVQAGSVLWCEGDPSDYVAFIIAGELELKKITEFSDHHIVLAILGHGSIAGEQALLKDQLRNSTAVAKENLELITLSSENFSRLVNVFPRAALSLLQCILLATSTRLQRANDRLTILF